ncbi:MAG: hypothetical protein KJ578_05970 [Bacteroidetes bacterium]|nr:hypothetical protein [Bacteroidota bacterium]MBU2557308.1 hypothetical protein [Bacteroidota bacterium]
MRWLTLCSLMLVSSVFAQQKSGIRVDTLLNDRWNVQQAVFDVEANKVLVVSEINERNTLFILEPGKSKLLKPGFTNGALQSANWDRNPEKLIASSAENGQLYRLDGQNWQYLLADRDVSAAYPVYNHSGNLLLFEGMRANQQNSSLFTYDFVYHNLNELDLTKNCQNPQWSPSDELISCTRAQDKDTEIALYHWYGAFYGLIKSDTLALRDACWTESDYRLIFVGEGKQFNYVLSSRKDGTDLKVLFSSTTKLSRPSRINGHDQLLLLQQTSTNRTQLLRIYLDEQSVQNHVNIKNLNHESATRRIQF